MKVGRKLLSVFIISLVTTAALFVFTLKVYAQPEIGCTGEIVKVANPEDDTPFTFTLFNGELGEVFDLSDPSNNVAPIFMVPGAIFDITEQVASGWVLESIQCDSDGPVEITVNEDSNSVEIKCIDSIALFQCEFHNVLAPVELAQVPTLSEWGLIAMASLLGIVGLIVDRRRKAAA